MLGASLGFADESGFCLVCPLKRTWAPKGHTPMVRTQLQHNTRLNVIGAVVVSPYGRRRLCTQTQAQPVKGEQIVAFLQYLLARVRGPLVLVWDNHPIPRRKHVQAFLARHPRLHVFRFPPHDNVLYPTLSEASCKIAPPAFLGITKRGERKRIAVP